MTSTLKLCIRSARKVLSQVNRVAWVDEVIIVARHDGDGRDVLVDLCELRNGDAVCNDGAKLGHGAVERWSTGEAETPFEHLQA